MKPRTHSLPAALTFSATLLALAPLSACGGGSDNLPPPPPPPPPPPTLTATAAPAPTTAPKPATPPKAELPKPELVAGAASPDPAAPLPTVKITAPKKDQVVAGAKANEFVVKLDVKNWQTAMGSSHVHLILDNKPYKPIYDTKAPVRLSELSGGQELTEGQHTLVAFPSRANHESVKTKGALTTLTFYVGKKGPATFDPKKPLLIYSRPKGEYKGAQANHVLIDFQVQNVTLAKDKEHVAVSVKGPGIAGELTSKVEAFGPPLYLDHLHNGEYTLKLELRDGAGKLVAGPWNSTTRTITVDRDAATPAMAHPAPKPDADAGAPGAKKPKPKK